MILTRFGLKGLVPLVLAGLSIASPVEKRGPDDDLAKIALDNVYKILNGSLSDGSTRTTCTKDTLIVRKE